VDYLPAADFPATSVVVSIRTAYSAIGALEGSGTAVGTSPLMDSGPAKIATQTASGTSCSDGKISGTILRVGQNLQLNRGRRKSRPRLTL
jgi:hypothetical protein